MELKSKTRSLQIKHSTIFQKRSAIDKREGDPLFSVTDLRA